MAPKEPETLEERMYRVELIQEQHEKIIGLVGPLEARMETVERKVEGFEPVLTSINSNLTVLVNDKIERDTLNKDRKGRKVEGRDWILAGVIVLTFFTGLPSMIQSYKSIVSGGDSSSSANTSATVTK